MSFTVATYNILASAYITPQWYAGVPEHLLRHESWVPAVSRHVAALGADVLCLQEIEPDVFASLAERLEPLGYAGYYEQKGRNRPDGCTTLVRAGAFAARHAHRLEYRDRESGEDATRGTSRFCWPWNATGTCSGSPAPTSGGPHRASPRGEQVGYR
jgi:mRNA deadenylase 3'-5' endonuclease subunit Ccr4